MHITPLKRCIFHLKGKERKKTEENAEVTLQSAKSCSLSPMCQNLAPFSLSLIISDTHTHTSLYHTHTHTQISLSHTHTSHTHTHLYLTHTHTHTQISLTHTDITHTHI